MPNPEIEDIELSLIQADVTDVLRVILSHKEQDTAGVLNLLTFSMAGLVAEESYGYFSHNQRMERFGHLNSDLFNDYRHSLTKVRCRLKLFDDTDKSSYNLISFLNLVRKQSKVLFSHPSSRVLQYLSAPFRPDIGVFFTEGKFVATTHAILPTIGVTIELLNEAKPEEFSNLHSYIFNFSKEMGRHFDQLAKILENQGHPIELNPQALTVDISHNDFVASKFYRYVEKALPSVPFERIPALTLCLGQVNTALYVLPQILEQNSILLARMQYLTAYHSSNALRESLRTSPIWLKKNDILTCRPLRNLFAHYELRKAGLASIGKPEPFDAALESVANQSREHITSITQKRLENLSEFLGNRLSKSDLQPVRALLGDHT